MYVSGEPPQPVGVAPGGTAYFFVAKYRCDSAVLGQASELRLALLEKEDRLTVQLPQGGVGALEYCRRYPGDQTPDPGNWVDVSAIVASPSANR